MKNQIFKCFGMGVLGIAVLCVAGASSAAERNPLKKYFSYEDVGGSGVDIALFGGLETKYDSNVFTYSSDDITTYDAGAKRTTKYADVDSLDDLSTDINLGVKFTKEFFEDSPTEFRHITKISRFSKNSVKDYESYSFEMKQRIRKDDIIKLKYSYLPEFLVRNLFDGDLGGYRKATFEKNTVKLTYWRRMNDHLRFNTFYQYSNKDYQSDFDERDSDTHAFNIAAIIPRLVFRNIKITPYYEYVTSSSQANDSDAGIDDDLSYNQNGFGLRGQIKIRNVDIKPYVGMKFKEFVTSQSTTDDPLHSGRNDEIFTIGIKAEYDLDKNITFFTGYRYRESNAKLAIDPSSTTLEDVLGYIDHLFAFGSKVRF